MFRKVLVTVLIFTNVSCVSMNSSVSSDEKCDYKQWPRWADGATGVGFGLGAYASGKKADWSKDDDNMQIVSISAGVLSAALVFLSIIDYVSEKQCEESFLKNQDRLTLEKQESERAARREYDARERNRLQQEEQEKEQERLKSEELERRRVQELQQQERKKQEKEMEKQYLQKREAELDRVLKKVRKSGATHVILSVTDSENTCGVTLDGIVSCRSAYICPLDEFEKSYKNKRLNFVRVSALRGQFGLMNGFTCVQSAASDNFLLDLKTLSVKEFLYPVFESIPQNSPYLFVKRGKDALVQLKQGGTSTVAWWKEIGHFSP